MISIPKQGLQFAADPKLPLVATRHYLIFGWKVIHMNYTYERAVSCGFPENIPYQSWRTVVQLSQKFSKLFLNRLLKFKATFWISALKMFLKLSLARHHSKRALNETLFIVFFPLFIFNQSSLLIFAQSVLHFCLNWDISAFCSEELRQPLWSPQKSSSHRFLVNAIVIQECLLLCLLCLFWTRGNLFFYEIKV